MTGHRHSLLGLGRRYSPTVALRISGIVTRALRSATLVPRPRHRSGMKRKVPFPTSSRGVLRSPTSGVRTFGRLTSHPLLGLPHAPVLDKGKAAFLGDAARLLAPYAQLQPQNLRPASVASRATSGVFSARTKTSTTSTFSGISETVA